MCCQFKKKKAFSPQLSHPDSKSENVLEKELCARADYWWKIDKNFLKNKHPVSESCTIAEDNQIKFTFGNFMLWGAQDLIFVT